MNIKVLGEWKEVAGVFTKVLGEWKQVTSGYTKVNGVWMEAYQSCPYDARIEYLQGTGTQYINTGIINTKNTELYVIFQLTEGTAEDRKIIGQGFKFGLGTINSKWRIVDSGWYQTSVSTDTNRHIFSTESGKYYIDSTQLADRYSNKTAGSYPMLIFAVSSQNSIATDGNCAKMKLYNCRIYDGSTLMRDYVPVRKDGVGYLYDRVSGELFGNAGSGNFTLGPDIIPVEYIQNTSTSYINTQYKPNQNTRVTCDMQVVTSTSYGRLFGCSSGTAWNSTPVFQVDYETDITGNLRYIIGNETSWNIISSITGDYDRHTYDFCTTSLIRDGVQVATHASTTFQCTTNLAIFSYMKSNGITTDSKGFMKGRCYSFQIYENDVLVRDYIPVRCGTVGFLYDQVNDRLYGNAGSGSFTVGSDVT